ncbi:MAG: FtsX-like permease family protein, partial [Bacteroidota bacterium]
VRLEQGVSQAQFEEKLAGFYEVHWGEDDQNKRESLALDEDVELGGLVATPLTELHLSPEIGWSRSINPQYGVILSAIALLILIIATINYVSLAMARANRRLREVGVRKTLGAHSGQIMVQFLGEAILLAMLAMILAAAWVELALPSFDQLIGHEMEVSILDQPQIILGLIGLSIFVGVLAGSYPAFFLGRFSPASVLKSHQQFKIRTGFTKALVVLQYSLTLFLIVSSMLMNRQMEYISEKDLGFNQDQIVAVPMGTGWSEAGERLYYQMKGALESHPDIHAISSTSLSFGHGWSRFGSSFEGKSFYAYAFRVDPQYIPSLEIDLKAGENFMPTRLIDTSHIIINETLAKQLGTDDPVGQNIPIFGTRPGPRVIGVVKDYHIFSLDQPIEPVVLHMDSVREKLSYLYFKVSPTRQAETVAAIRESYEQFQHDVPFQHYYLDEDLATQYNAHQRRTRLMQIATLFAILIACLGLFALASLNAANRTKEIGIRKVFGADLGRLLLLLNREVLLLALLAFAIGAPSAAYFMQEWLDQFLFQTKIDWSLFVFALGIAVGLALLTVSYQVIRVAMTRPSEALRHE